MRIGLIAPPWYAVPPEGYGGVERLVHLLAVGLRERGHHVTLFGREGSSSGDVVFPLAPAAWSEEMGSWVHKLTYLGRVHRALEGLRLELLHDHCGSESILLASLQYRAAPAVATVHEPVGEPEAAFLSEAGGRVALVAVSEAQVAGAPLVPAVPWAAVVPNAVDLTELFGPTSKEGYLVELARIDPAKGQHLAIEVARRLGLPLVLAGKLDPIAESVAYFKAEIEPHLGYDVRWIPEVRGRARAELLARALAMVAPLRWQEPFGLAMAEAIASGTPVVALRRGAACELVEEGVTGFLADDVDGLVAAVHRARHLDPSACARRGRERFAPARMVERYEALYQDMLPGR